MISRIRCYYLTFSSFIVPTVAGCVAAGELVTAAVVLAWHPASHDAPVEIINSKTKGMFSTCYCYDVQRLCTFHWLLLAICIIAPILWLLLK